MKKALMILLASVLIGHATVSHAQRGPCQPTPFNPGGCSWRGGGWGPGWDPYPGTRSGGQNAVLYANAVAVGLPAVVGAVGALANAIVGSPEPPPQQIAEAPIGVAPVGVPVAIAPVRFGGNQCVWRSFNPTIMDPRFRFGDRRVVCVNSAGIEYSFQAPPIQ